jgi:phosphoribosylformylglycinamidine synthase
VTGHGINAHIELAKAFERAGAQVGLIHLDELLTAPERLGAVEILAIPGGFSYGDHLGSGKVLAWRLRRGLGQAVSTLVSRGGLVLGVCNGFQVLVKSGLLPNTVGNRRPEVSLIHNSEGAFIDRWVRLRVEEPSPSPWLQGLTELELPIRNGEGRFVFGNDETKSRLLETGCIALRYAEENPNGSELDVAGICDTTGQILGLMPHPEAYQLAYNHPRWTRGAWTHPTGLALFENAVRYFRGA